MQYSKVMFVFSVIEREYPFRASLLQRIKIIRLNWNMVPWLIRTCRIQWWCSKFLFLNGVTFFWVIMIRKMRVVSFSWNLVLSLTKIWRIQWWYLIFLFLNGSVLFNENFVSKNLNSLLKLKFGTDNNWNM